ncbi:MAG: alpha/beta fold hydrolase [Anaerolineales bacterium]
MLPLVLLPGTLCDSRLWSHQKTHLSDVALVSVGDLSRDDTVAGMARSVLEAAPPQFALAGLSMGGIVALEIMRQAPTRVTSLVLLNTNARPMRPSQITLWQDRIARVHSGQFDEVLEQDILPSWLQAERSPDRELMTTIRQMARSAGANVFVRQAQANMGRVDSRPSLAQIACPTLVLAGRQDDLCPPELHEEMAAAIPGARLVMIEQCGHLSALEQPQAVTAVLHYWLQLN